MIFTFWEGDMPEYIKLCMRTWTLPFTILNYDNVLDYTTLDVEGVKRFTLPQIVDCVRVHVLRDNGGYWLDADTIMLTDELPETNMVGHPDTRANNIGFLHTEKESQMFKEWAEHQDVIIKSGLTPTHWGIMGNTFTDSYVKEHPEITIGSVEEHFPETYMIQNNMSRYMKYLKFYFESNYHLVDLKETNLLMLHNSWTPSWYKCLSKQEILDNDCTMSNILKELLCNIS